MSGATHTKKSCLRGQPRAAVAQAIPGFPRRLAAAGTSRVRAQDCFWQMTSGKLLRVESFPPLDRNEIGDGGAGELVKLSGASG